MRKLTSIRTIDKIVPHKNADRLEVAIIGGWPAVVRKGQFRERQLVVFCEVDTLLPPHSEFDFLGEPTHTEPDGTKWHRLRTMRLRGQLSQGIVFPVERLEQFAPFENGHLDPRFNGVIGQPNWQGLLSSLRQWQCPMDGCEYAMDDWNGVSVDAFIGARKYEKPLAPNLAGTAKGPFPYFIPRTDEERIQNLDTDEFAGLRFHRSEKLDGSSCTVYIKDGNVGVCSRNLELVQNEDNTFWKATKHVRNVLETKYPDWQLAIQGELCGPGIQGNRYGLTDHQFFAFNLYRIDRAEYTKKLYFEIFCETHEIQTAPLLDHTFCPKDVQDILANAEGCSQLNTNVEREGVVWVNDKHGVRFSFKAISNKFLLGGGE